MVLVQRKIRVIFIVQSNRTLTQIRNYVTNTLFPEWDVALASAFSGYQFANTVTSIIKTPYVILLQGFNNRYEVYPKYFYQGEVTQETEADARARQANFIEELRVRTRNLLASLSGTSVLQIHKDDVDGQTVVSTT